MSAELAAAPQAPSGMRRCLFALIAALAVGGAVAQDGDALRSAACRQSLDALQAQEAAALSQATQPPDAPSRRAAAARLEALRKQAARACLGGQDGAAPVQRLAQPPVAVPSVARPPPAHPPGLPARPDAPPAVPARTPKSVTSCDAAGCWASDGSRLQRAGPNLIGPRGVCTTQGVLLHCP